MCMTVNSRFNPEFMPLECLCRLVDASLENRASMGTGSFAPSGVTAASALNRDRTSSCPSGKRLVLLAYAELLRTVARLLGGDVTPGGGVERVGNHMNDGAPCGANMKATAEVYPGNENRWAGIQAMDIGSVIR